MFQLLGGSLSLKNNILLALVGFVVKVFNCVKCMWNWKKSSQGGPRTTPTLCDPGSGRHGFDSEGSWSRTEPIQTVVSWTPNPCCLSVFCVSIGLWATSVAMTSTFTSWMPEVPTISSLVIYSCNFIDTGTTQTWPNQEAATCVICELRTVCYPEWHVPLFLWKIQTTNCGCVCWATDFEENNTAYLCLFVFFMKNKSLRVWIKFFNEDAESSCHRSWNISFTPKTSELQHSTELKLYPKNGFQQQAEIQVKAQGRSFCIQYYFATPVAKTTFMSSVPANFKGRTIFAGGNLAQWTRVHLAWTIGAHLNHEF